MSNYCDDCGCKVYRGLCVNCHEETFIYEQNYSNDEPISLPESFMEKVSGQTEVRKEYYRKLPPPPVTEVKRSEDI